MSTTTIVAERQQTMQPRTKFQRIRGYLKRQSVQVHGKTLLAYALCAPLPKYVGAEWRAFVLRRVGFAIGANSGFFGTPKLYGEGDYYPRLTIGQHCWINIGCHFELNAPIRIGNHVSIGPEVMLLTGTHAMGTTERRAAAFVAHPVTIGNGVWIGARCIVLPGVTIGAGSVIAAGTTVSRDVPPNTMLSGTQGMPIEKWQALTKLSTAAR